VGAEASFIALNANQADSRAVDGSIGDHAWFEHLSDDDLSLVARLAPSAGVDAGRACSDSATLFRVLAHPAAFATMFPSQETTAWVPASPFLIFAVLVHHGWVELQHVQHVDEWIGARQRLPVLGGDDLRDFLGSPDRRLFLTELLASYTRVASGSTWVRTRRGWRRRRFSDLDPVRLAQLLDVVPDVERAAVWQRLGDLALFLTGVFPDHTELHGLRPLDEVRLLRMSGMSADAVRDRAGAAEGTVAVLERLGARWYGLAARSDRGSRRGTTTVVADVAHAFRPARRTLNYLTDRYLFTRRSQWFGDLPG
jgi:hypothetical protein